MQHGEQAAPEEVPWPALDRHAQEYRRNDERRDIHNNGRIGRDVAGVQGGQYDHVEPCAGADGQSQRRLVEFAVLFHVINLF